MPEKNENMLAEGGGVDWRGSLSNIKGPKHARDDRLSHCTSDMGNKRDQADRRGQREVLYCIYPFL